MNENDTSRGQGPPSPKYRESPPATENGWTPPAEDPLDADRDHEARGTRHFAALELFYRWRKFIFVNVLAASLLAAGVSFLLPKTYTATASVLPPKQNDIFSSLGGVASSIAKSIPGAARLGLGQRPSGYNYFAILNSRTALEDIVRKFNLISVYDISDSSMEKAVKKLTSNVDCEEQPEDNITITVRDRDPERAAAIANAFIDVLNRISVQLGTAEARNNREFIGQRLDQARADLKNAEDALKDYQEKSKMIITTEQSASLSGMATLYALRARREVELGVLRHSVNADDPNMRALTLEIAEINRKLGNLPKIGVESLRRYREVLIQQQIVEFLIPMFEQAKIDEVKDIPVVLLLDKAVPPERKTSPQRLLIVLVTFFLTLFACIFLVYLLQWLSQSAADGPVGRWLRQASRAIARKYRIELLD